jgi:apolipoprotein N-acyltransferase
LFDERLDTPRPWLLPLASVLVVAGFAAYGALRLSEHPTRFVDGVRLRIVQPNLAQDVKFNYSAKQQVMSRYLAMSDRATGPSALGVRDITHLIWPESAFPFFLSREPDALAQIADLLPEGTILITGGVRPASARPGVNEVRAYNSVYVIGDDGTILSTYDKMHLVPFGEYLPFQRVLERTGLQQLTKVHGGFVAGDRRRPIAVPRAPDMLALVCYEIIFPGEAVPRGAARPGWLVNVTNDGWFGNSSGPYQHFQQARLRAIEEGLPVVRAANTGISAVIDPLGRVINSLPLGVDGVLDARLPQAIAPTFYVRSGDGTAGLVVVAAFALVMQRRFRRQRT